MWNTRLLGKVGGGYRGSSQRRPRSLNPPDAKIRLLSGFLAPEVYSKAEAGSKADIFSLGVVLYYLLTQSQGLGLSLASGLGYAVPVALESWWRLCGGHAFLRDSPLETEIATKSSRQGVEAARIWPVRLEAAFPR